MANHESITRLIKALTALGPEKVYHSEPDKRRAAKRAQDLVWHSELEGADRESVYLAIGRRANPSGFHYDGTGIAAGIAALESLLEPEPAPALTCFNARNLHNLVADGAIFSVEFIKRSDGSLNRPGNSGDSFV